MINSMSQLSNGQFQGDKVTLNQFERVCSPSLAVRY